ncbi:MAG: enoyl-ACP reductase FabI [Rickettsiales bacterium]|nr:enoyl-ACP reductase FabI [Rickettsiales bacterium]
MLELENYPKGNLMAGKKGLIMGVANDKSIAWGITKALYAQGCRDFCFSYQGEALQKRVTPLAKEAESEFLVECDVTNSDSIKNLFETIKQKWGKIDFLVHAIGFSDKNELRGKYLNTSLNNFLNTMHISCFSFTEVAKYCYDMMPDGGSLLTLTYYGGEKVMPHYNVMGVAKAALEMSTKYLAKDMGDRKIRVNAISAGPVKTLAASGIGDFRLIFKWNEYNAPLKRNVDLEDIGGAAVYLLSDLSRGTTGEIHHVDSGYNVIGMKDENAPDLTIPAH